MTKELVQQANAIRKKILTMEWDLSQGQLHAAKVQRINSYKEQLQAIEAQMLPKSSSVAVTETNQ